jgi:hypothetical protein
MELETLLNDPVRRRCWLLSKALEIGSLQDAVRLAREADAFVLLGRDDKIAGPAIGRGERLQTAEPDRNGSSRFAGPPGETADRPPATRAEHNGEENHAGLNGKSMENVETIIFPGNDDRAGAPAGDEAILPNGDADLAVLAGIEDIVRYLRQRDDVVVPENGFFLVNGRFRLSPEELLGRANKMRARQGKPLFQRMPLGFPQEHRLAASPAASAAE